MATKEVVEQNVPNTANVTVLESAQYELRIVSVNGRTGKNDAGKDVRYYMFSAINLTNGRKMSFSISEDKAVAYGWISGVRQEDGKTIQVKGTMDSLLTSGLGEVYVTVHLTEVPEVGLYGYKDRSGIIHEYRNGTIVFDQFDGFISKESVREYEAVHTAKASTSVLEERVRTMFASMMGHEFRPGNPDDVPIYMQLAASLK